MLINYNHLINLLELDSVKKIITNNKKANTDSFNIFKVLKISENEVIICRLLGELLNPQGAHGFGSQPLKVFLKSVLDVNEFDDDVDHAYIVLEEPVSLEDRESDSCRRADIVIHIKERVYPIEVKIWAGDQPKQLYDYYRYFFGNDKDKVIYYLTPDGHEPSKNSICELVKTQYKTISFKTKINNWLDLLLKENDKVNTNQCRMIIEQFKEIINDMENSNNKTIKELVNLVSFDDESKLSKENIDALIFICEHSEDIKQELQAKYLEKNIICDSSKYVISVVDNSVPKPNSYSKQARLYIQKEDVEFWISVDGEGPYIISNKRINDDRWTNEKECSWCRISDSYNKKMKMFGNESFDITNILNTAMDNTM